MPNKPLYVHIDESGDFEFSPKGSKFYTLTAVITHVPWEGVEKMTELRHKILAGTLCPKLDSGYVEDHLSHKFHASEDKQEVRDLFFGEIASLEHCIVNSVVVRKNKTNPSLYDPERFYPKITISLVDYILKRYINSKLCIYIDGMPVNGKKAFIKTIKSLLNERQPGKSYSIFCPKSESNVYLQVCDYVNWAIFRKWEQNDMRSYELIKGKLRAPELDMFARGDREYYKFKNDPAS